MKKFQYALLSLFFVISVQSLSAQELKSLRSPNGDLQLMIRMTKEGNLSYSFMAGGKQFINNSLLGFGFDNNKSVPSVGWRIQKTMKHSVNTIWKPVWGKRAVVPDQYNELILDLTGPDPNIISALRIEARAYNDGVAFRYSVPSDEKNSSVPSAELTRYNFAGDYTAWFYNGEHENIGPEKLSDSNGKRLPVMTIKADKDAYLAIHEADLSTGEPLVLDSKNNETSFSVVSVPGKLEAGYHSAWRVILFGKTPGALIDSHLIELLNPQAKGDFSWVKPGVAVWDWRIDGAKTEGFIYSMSYPSWVRMIDFAAENKIRYLILDANWYGPEHKADSDPVKGDKASDVRKLLAYGKDKGVGIWLYLNDVGGRKFPIEQTLKQYGDWGASGINPHCSYPSITN